MHPTHGLAPRVRALRLLGCGLVDWPASAIWGGDDFVSTILVTGGAGYIGSMVSRELLARGHRVVVADALLFGGEALLDLLSNPAFSFRKVDICVPGELEALFAERRFDAVVHLASIVGDPACKAQPELATN